MWIFLVFFLLDLVQQYTDILKHDGIFQCTPASPLIIRSTLPEQVASYMASRYTKTLHGVVGPKRASLDNCHHQTAALTRALAVRSMMANRTVFSPNHGS